MTVEQITSNIAELERQQTELYRQKNLLENKDKADSVQLAFNVLNGQTYICKDGKDFFKVNKLILNQENNHVEIQYEMKLSFFDFNERHKQSHFSVYKKKNDTDYIQPYLDQTYFIITEDQWLKYLKLYNSIEKQLKESIV